MLCSAPSVGRAVSEERATWLQWLQNYGVWVLANLAADEENRLLIVTALNSESLG